MPFVAYSSGSVYLSGKPSLPDFIRTNRSPAGIGEVWVETYGAAVPDGHRTMICGCDVIGARPDWSTYKAWPNGSCTNPPQSAYRTDEARTDRTGLCRLIARRGPGLPNLCRLLVGRHALPEHPAHLTLGGDASTSGTSKAI